MDNHKDLVLLNSLFTASGSAILWLMVAFLHTGQSSNLDILYGVMAGLAGGIIRFSCNNTPLFSIDQRTRSQSS